MGSMYEKPIKLRRDKAIGYFYFSDRTHPLANSQGKVYYHRHVASLKIGRWLTTDEHAHHIDGDRGNNAPENLVVLTAREHALEHNPPPMQQPCDRCGTPTAGRFCSQACAHLSRRRFNPPKEELERLVQTMPTVKVAAHYGVSDKAIEKRCKLLGIQKPSRGHWMKHASVA